MPPISRVNFFNVFAASTAKYLPVCVDPVKVIIFTRGISEERGADFRCRTRQNAQETGRKARFVE